MCITDIFTILIRALKCFRLSFLALMPLSLLLFEVKKNYSSTRLLYSDQQIIPREIVLSSTCYASKVATLDAIKNHVRYRARITRDKMLRMLISCLQAFMWLYRIFRNYRKMQMLETKLRWILFVLTSYIDIWLVLKLLKMDLFLVWQNSSCEDWLLQRNIL